MKDVDLIKAIRDRSGYDWGYSWTLRALLSEAADRLEELTKATVEPHPQQTWNLGRKNSEDYND